MSQEPLAQRRSTAAIKRLVDLMVAGLALIVTAPVICLAVLLIYVEDRRSAWFLQPRLGRGSRQFKVFKLRSMTVHKVSTEAMGQVGSDHPLVTRVGKWIRRFKIDELPQLVNVLMGDMSIVGPRPASVDKLEGYDEFQLQRLWVRPGLTGWAQVNGNVEATWDERILLDVWYVHHGSLWLDLRIMLKTVGVVLFGERLNPQVLKEASAYAQRSGWSRS
jgi:lipopolysaccharide/colanic/teichoic acid biosynthesis glycosyltransferase